MLLTLVIVYLLITIAIGLIAARRVKNTTDFAIAGRHLPLYMIVTTTFATWFGSETVLGIPAKFIEGGLNGVIEDPFDRNLHEPRGCAVLQQLVRSLVGHERALVAEAEVAQDA